MRAYRENYNTNDIRIIKLIPPEQFIGLLKKAVCLVGKSSSGIKECSYLGVPAINIGTRQNGRLRGENVIDVPYNKKKIKDAIKAQMSRGKYKRNDIYHQDGGSKKIVHILATIPCYTQKRFYDGKNI